MSAPGCMTMGVRVSMRKRSSGGVIASRFSAAAKKAKTRWRGTGSVIEASSTAPWGPNV